MLRIDPGEKPLHLRIRRDPRRPLGVHLAAARRLGLGESVKAFTHSIRHPLILTGRGPPMRHVEYDPAPPGTRENGGMSYSVNKTDAEWRAELGEEQYAVLRNAATERPWTGELLDESRSGLYTCGACDAELFRSSTKFDSGCGWPSFYESVRPEAVELIEDRTLGMVRTEVRCAACGSHLGHVFPDGFGTPTGDRYCMNSVALSFTPDA